MVMAALHARHPDYTSAEGLADLCSSRPAYVLVDLETDAGFESWQPSRPCEDDRFRVVGDDTKKSGDGLLLDFWSTDGGVMFGAVVGQRERLPDQSTRESVVLCGSAGGMLVKRGAGWEVIWDVADDADLR
jgi:hypothetical protein